MNRTIVVFSLEPWDGVWRRNQYLVDGLLRRHRSLRVVFVEPARDHLHDLVAGRATPRAAGLREAPGYDGRLMLFQPAKWLPRAAGPLADFLLRRSVSRALGRTGATDVVRWINDPGWAHAVVHGEEPAIYDITDDWLAADRPRRQLDRLARNEEDLFRWCRAVIVCSPELQSRKSGQRPDVVLIPNAVDLERYRRPVPRPADLPAGPVALYVGTLHEDRLDVPLTVETASALSALGGSVVLVGPVSLAAANREALERTPGVRLCGPRDFGAVPGYLQHADVLIVPHLVDAFTDSLDPIKLYEYLAVGRPVVSTPVAGFRDTDSDAISLARREQFPSAVLSAVSAPGVTFDASVPTWADRCDMLWEVLQPVVAP